jgi:glycerophosphoryl diester phosphodiesterase
MENSWIRMKRPLVIAHRGHGIAAPENTLIAYALAKQAGAEMIETDVNITKDGHLVIIHDWRLGRTTDIKGMVHEYTVEELRKADAGSWFDKKYTNEKIPTLNEAIQFAQNNNIYMCFEVKGGNPDRALEISTRLVETLRKADAFEWAFMSSYFHESLAEAKKRAPQLMLAPERIPDDVEPDLEEAFRQVRYLNSNVLQIHYKYLYPNILRAMREEGIALWAWPTTTEEEIIPAIKTGADGVMGDDPTLAVKLVKQLCDPAL